MPHTSLKALKVSASTHEMFPSQNKLTSIWLTGHEQSYLNVNSFEMNPDKRFLCSDLTNEPSRTTCVGLFGFKIQGQCLRSQRYITCCALYIYDIRPTETLSFVVHLSDKG
jgi:hypothetical protein